ncbi:MAG: PLxRFG domain-containing protein [Paracoccus sp.]|nr:PLxRFG domain-containing protein [Paracoccus sp. (in: a-proteobacteria)]
MSIENKAGSTRSGTDPDGRGWSVTMPAHYGRVLRTEGADGDHVDFYMGPNEASQDVWVVDQIDADTGTFDEHKTMLGFDSAQEARAAHAAAFSDGKGPARMGGITKMSAGDLKAWLKDGDTKSPLSVKARRKAAVQNAIEKDAPAIAGSEDPQATADQNRVKNPQRRPFVNYVANTLGGVNPGGKFANELRYRGITARVAPGLFRRGGHRDLDNIVASEHSELTGAIALSDDGIYLSPQSILDAIIAEVAGEPLAFGRHAQDQMAARDAVRSRADMDDTTRPQDEPVAVPDRERDIRMDDERRSDIEREVEAELEQMGLAWALTEDAKRAIIDGIDRDGGFIPDAIYSEVVRSARDDIRETPDNGRAADQIQDVPFGDEGDVGGPGADTGAESGAGPEGDGAGSSEQGEGRNLRPAEDGGLATEPGADGLPQVILPGMERDEGQRQSSLTVRQRAEIEARQQQSKARRLDGNAGDAGPLFNEQQDLLSETPSSDAPTRPDPLRKNAKAQALERAEAIRDYFTPGNIVSSYGGGRDRVISFAATDDGGFNVTVEAVRQDGDAWVAEGTPRTHSTIPDARQLRSGPIERVASDNTKESRFTDDPVATLTGDELGEWSDIRDLRIKAQNWYRDHLQGQVITNEATGWEIRLTRAAKGKMGGKGQFLLQAVPALERIIAKAEKVGEAGEVKGRDHIKAYHYLRAPIVIDGERESLIVTVREMQDGRKFYDLNRDNLVGTRTRGPMDAREARVEPDVEIGTDTLNMAIENERVNGSDPEMAPADARRINAAARAELEKIGIAGRVRAKAGGEGRAAGTYQRGVIRILRTRAGKWRHTLDHEILHALRDPDAWGGEAGLFTRPEWSALARAARADRDVRDRVEAAYPDLTEAGRTEEMVAEFYADWAQGNREAPAGPLAQALGRIRSFFNAVASALRGEGFQDAASIMRRIAGGEVGGRGPDRPSTGLGAAREQRNMDGLTAAQTEPSFATRYNLSNPLHRARGLIGNAHWRDTPKLFSDFLSNKMTDSMGSESASSLALVPGRALFSELGKGIQAAQRYLHEKEAMDAERNDWHGRGDKVAKSWWKLRLKDSASNQQLMDLMHRATLSGIDPSKPDGWEHPMADKLPRLEKSGDPGARMEAETIRSEIEGRMRAYAKLKGEFDALPQAFKELFNTVRDEYTGLADAMDAALIENMKIASEIGLKRAQRTHRKEMRRIEEEGLTGPERDNAILEADTALDAAERQAKAGTAERMVALRRQFESNRLSGPYFPLARFGKYFVTIKDPAGKVVSFSRFERKAQQDAFVRDAEERGLGAIERGSLDTGPDLKTMVDPVFVADVEGMLQKAGANPELMDAVWQHWLQTLPDQSIRTNQIHRKGRTGYNPDAFRAFGKQMFHGSHQLARLKHGLKMSEILQEAKEEAARSDNPERDTFVVQEMQRRHEFTMNPKGAPWTSALTSIGFVWYLGMSPAAALVNVSQTTLIGVPMMGHRFKKAGVSGSVTAITKAMRDFADGRGWSEKSSRLTDEEKAAMDQAYRLGTIDKTQAHDLASVAESGVEYSPLRQAVMEKIGFMFHHAERLNREVTFLANYRLAKADGMDHETAIREASDLTWKIHFDYQNSARPRIMQNDVAKVVLLFRSYTVNLLWRLFRDTHQTFHGKSPEARAEAKAQLVGITLSMMAHAGIRGVWGYGIIMGLLGVFFPGGDDDAEKWMENALLMEGDDPGTAAWNWMMKLLLDGAPGQLTGVDLTQRIGSPSLWFRDSGRDLEGADAWNHLVNDMLGPVFGIGAGVVKGVSMMSRDPWRGIEASMPKFIRDPMQAYRFATEGATTLNGDPLIENMGPGEVLAKISGFTPARLSHRYRLNNWLKNDEKRIMERRKDLHRSIGRAVREGEPISDKLRGKIEAFNREYPFYPITADSIRQSVRGQIRASERNEGGVQLNPRLDRHIREGLPPSRGA